MKFLTDPEAEIWLRDRGFSLNKFGVPKEATLPRFRSGLRKRSFSTRHEAAVLIILAHRLAKWLLTSELLLNLTHLSSLPRQGFEFITERREEMGDRRSIGTAPCQVFDPREPGDLRLLAESLLVLMAFDWYGICYHSQQESWLRIHDMSVKVYTRTKAHDYRLCALLDQLAVTHRPDWSL